MSESGAGGAGDPFGGIPFFGDLAKMLSQSGPVNWETARQLAFSIATGGETEPNVDPMERIQLEQFSRIAELHVGAITGLATSTSGGLTILPVTRSHWVNNAFKVYEPYFEAIAKALKPGSAQEPGTATSGSDPFGLANMQAFSDPNTDPEAAMEAWFEQMMTMLAPVMLGMSAGSLIGHLSTRSFGQYDLPIPQTANDELLLIWPNIKQFGEEWSLDPIELRLWVCLHEIAHHTILSIPHVAKTLQQLLLEFVSAFEPDSSGLTISLENINPNDPTGLASMQSMLSDPEVLLGAMRTSQQDDLLARLDAITTVIVGYVDWVMDEIGQRLMASYGQITEAIRRRRVEASSQDRFVGKILGLDLTQAHYERGSKFIAGVVERSGAAALSRLWEHPQNLPTPNEVAAPGLWLARIDLPHDEA